MAQTASPLLDPPAVPSPRSVTSAAASPRSTLRRPATQGGSRVLEHGRAPAQLSLFGRGSNPSF